MPRVTVTAAGMPVGATAGDTAIFNGGVWVAGPVAPSPALNGLATWNYPVDNATAGVQAIAGTKYVQRVPVAYTKSGLTNVWVIVATAGSVLSGVQGVSVFDSTGALLGTSADQTANWGASGAKNAIFSAFAIAPPCLYVEILSTAGTTIPNFRAAIGSSQNFNLNVSGAALRTSTNGAGASALDASITPGSLSTANAPLPFWVGVN
jgi:hypothetical protein